MDFVGNKTNLYNVTTASVSERRPDEGAGQPLPLGSLSGDVLSSLHMDDVPSLFCGRLAALGQVAYKSGLGLKTVQRSRNFATSAKRSDWETVLKRGYL
jgi:hypothetical protein